MAVLLGGRAKVRSLKKKNVSPRRVPGSKVVAIKNDIRNNLHITIVITDLGGE